MDHMQGKHCISKHSLANKPMPVVAKLFIDNIIRVPASELGFTGTWHESYGVSDYQ